MLYKITSYVRSMMRPWNALAIIGAFIIMDPVKDFFVSDQSYQITIGQIIARSANFIDHPLVRLAIIPITLALIYFEGAQTQAKYLEISRKSSEHLDLYVEQVKGQIQFIDRNISERLERIASRHEQSSQFYDRIYFYFSQKNQLSRLSNAISNTVAQLQICRHIIGEVEGNPTAAGFMRANVVGFFGVAAENTRTMINLASISETPDFEKVDMRELTVSEKIAAYQQFIEEIDLLIERSQSVRNELSDWLNEEQTSISKLFTYPL